jgi:hypothetical protein
MDAFESPKLLLRNAMTDIDRFTALCDQTVTNGKHRRVVDYDPKTAQKIYKVVFDEGIFPDELRILAHGIIVNLRHTLDMAACAAFETVTGQPAEKLYFPIAANPNDLAGRLEKNFPVPLHDAFFRIRPYPTDERTPLGNDTICRLAKAAQRKHQVVCKVSGRVTALHAHRMVITGGGQVPWPKWDETKNEIVIATADAGGSIDYDICLSFFVTLYGVGPIDGEPAVDTLKGFWEAVNVSVSTIETAALGATP